jgi:hypothetical protein
MTRKTALTTLALADAVLLLAFSVRYSHHRSFAPLLVFLLPLFVCHFIYYRELISPAPDALINGSNIRSGSLQAALPLAFMSFFVGVGIVRLVRFDSSLGWSVPVCLGLSAILCLGLIAAYGAVKSALKPKTLPSNSQ